MFLKKRWLMMVVVTAVLLLGACGDDSTASGDPVVGNDGPQDRSPDDFIPISEALEEYSVWLVTSDTPDRNSTVSGMYVFENGEVSYYPEATYQGDRLTLEEINNLTDDEIIEYAKENTFMDSDGKYSLDITLDSLGQSTEVMDIIMTEGLEVRSLDLGEIISQRYDSQWSELKDEYPMVDDYSAAVRAGEVEITPVEDSETYEIAGDEMISTRIIEGKSMETVEPRMVHQTILETTYSGLSIGNSNSIVTRVDHSFPGFKLDGPDTDKENVTVEAMKEVEEQRKEEEQRESEEQMEEVAQINPGEEMYTMNCATCHGAELSGGAGPDLLNVGSKYSVEEIKDIILNGTNSMPPIAIENEDAIAIAEWLNETQQ